MISKIKFSNYKAFEYGEIEFRPITILLGANSVGKSSILNLLLMLQQTAAAEHYKSALRLNGDRIALGEVKNIFRNRDTEIPLKISFEFNNASCIIEFLEDTIFDLVYLLDRLLSNKFRTVSLFLKMKRSEKSPEELISKVKYFFSKLEPYDKKRDYEGLLSVKISSKKEYDEFVSQLEQSLSLIETIYDNVDKKLSVDFEIVPETQLFKDTKHDSNHLRVKNFKVSFDDTCFIAFIFSVTGNKLSYNCLSDLLTNIGYLDNHKDDQAPIVSYEDTIFGLFGEGYENLRWHIDAGIYAATMTSICSGILDIIKEQFDESSIEHVSPTRAYPQRYYILDSANDIEKFNSRDGNSLAEILKENKFVKASVNKLLSHFNLNVDVKNLYDIIHTLKIHQNGLDLDLPDVGFGISQVLPVIVQSYMAQLESLLLIEQPEIHLHPKMQADLADMFIDIVNKRSKSDKLKYMLIETHSEYLLKRLRRRIGEGYISNEKVGVYFISPDQNLPGSPSVIKEEEVYSSGYFSYPPNFMDEEIEKDTISFIKQQFNL
ncbi:MAG: AAA family ATPase [Bacteroidaceae bacterium]|nr:AAA family ATPase [Bacteroidaceae bacterium]